MTFHLSLHSRPLGAELGKMNARLSSSLHKASPEPLWRGGDRHVFSLSPLSACTQALASDQRGDSHSL